MKLHTSLLLIFTFFIYQKSYSQEEEENPNCYEPDKSVMKLLKAAEDTKQDMMTRTQSFTDAVESAGDNAVVHFAFANFNWDRALKVQDAFDAGRANFDQLRKAYEGAANSYKKAVESCPEIHSDAYYKLGFIYYMLNDKGQAAKYFKQFLQFKSSDSGKYSEEYAKNKADVEEILPEMEFFDKFFSNPVPFVPLEVRNVASEKDEFLPMVSPDNELLFFTRKGESDNPSGIINPIIEEFSVAQRPGSVQDFDKGVPLKRPFNSPKFQNYGGVSLSIDNKEMYICACQKVDYQEHTNCDLYVTRFERSGEGGYDFTWSELQNLGPAINTPDGWEAQPTLSPDGNTLYFATWRENSKLTDIYYSTRDKSGAWTPARPMPGPINSEGHDKAPFLHQDSETMYFVSDCIQDEEGRRGAGGSDIFYSRRDAAGNWQAPKNIGHPINTNGNEVGLVVSTDGHLAYFTSRNAGSNGYDIYYFVLYQEARPQEVIMVKGEVKSEDGNPIEDATVEISYRGEEKSVEVHVNGDDGKFAAIIHVDKGSEADVMLTVKKEGYSFDTQLIKTTDVKRIAQSTDVVVSGLNMAIDPIKVGKAFTIDNILFNTDSYELLPDSKFVLEQFIKFLKENPTVKVTIEGHTDDLGDAAHNKTLSSNRAKSALDFIVSKGIDPTRLKSTGYGEDKPKVPNESDENRALNRRTDFLITSM